MKHRAKSILTVLLFLAWATLASAQDNAKRESYERGAKGLTADHDTATNGIKNINRGGAT